MLWYSYDFYKPPSLDDVMHFKQLSLRYAAMTWCWDDNQLKQWQRLCHDHEGRAHTCSALLVRACHPCHKLVDTNSLTNELWNAEPWRFLCCQLQDRPEKYLIFFDSTAVCTTIQIAFWITSPTAYDRTNLISLINRFSIARTGLLVWQTCVHCASANWRLRPTQMSRGWALWWLVSNYQLISMLTIAVLHNYIMSCCTYLCMHVSIQACMYKWM